ncbi:bucky ball-like [Corythoichthys intestinalis]|uniref:bucky ball-like n=1 Tax=Corythoichthys intestinalis TaxID=161448 RepID=UPI0025A5112B|nr:bucky ball-like [Corythoichthys intestinalis]
MEDGSKPPHSCSNGQQRNHHPRPFFYVQPPSQPYYLYQHWQMNNPLNHYGVPAGFNFGRPYMAPFQYVPYGGLVFPPSPLYPMDYRRTFEPRFYAPAWNDGPRPQHHPQPQSRRETVSSEVQTDPSDPLSKLMECLNKIQVTELQGPEKELDSGVASHASGMFSPAEEKKGEEQGDGSLLPAALGSTTLESPAVVFRDSTTAVYDAESSHRSLDALSPQACWSGTVEVDLPLDSSSIHEDGPDPEHPPPVDSFLFHDKSDVTDIQSDIPVAKGTSPKFVADDIVSVDSLKSWTPSSIRHKDRKSVCKALSEVDPDYQILQLPLEGVLGSAGSRLSSPSTPYYYPRLSMQTTHERMSVLSPSLDELSSRDEMFSTDLDDMNLFPRQAYSGRKLAEVVGGDEMVDDSWLFASNKVLCACCGKNLPKGSSRSKGHLAKTYRDDVADSDEDVRFRRGCAPLRKHPTHRKPHSGPSRQPARPWYKRSPYKDPVDALDPDQCLEDKPAEAIGGELQCRTCQDKFCRDEQGVSEQGKWAGGGLPRRRQAAPAQRLESTAPRKLMLHQRPQDDYDDGHDDDDKELQSSHWDRGSSVREQR